MLIHSQGIIRLLNQAGIYNIKIFSPFFILNFPSSYSPLAEHPMQSSVCSMKTNTRSRIILSVCMMYHFPAGRGTTILFISLDNVSFFSFSFLNSLLLPFSDVCVNSKWLKYLCSNLETIAQSFAQSNCNIFSFHTMVGSIGFETNTSFWERLPKMARDMYHPFFADFLVF